MGVNVLPSLASNCKSSMRSSAVDSIWISGSCRVGLFILVSSAVGRASCGGADVLGLLRDGVDGPAVGVSLNMVRNVI